MSSHRSRRLIYTMAAALALFTALTGMASASVPGLQRVSASSLNSISAREVQGGSVNNWMVKGYAICATA